jgi:hypothetical protein
MMVGRFFINATNSECPHPQAAGCTDNRRISDEMICGIAATMAV